jgi:hypothetical protein
MRNNMARSRWKKIDWSARKLEFLESDFLEVAEFFRHLLGTNKLPWNIKLKTKWWSKDKAQWLGKIREKVLEEAEKEMIKLRKPDMQKLWNIHKNIFNMLVEYSNQIIWKWNPSIPKISIKELKTLREIVKTEKWEPTRVSENKNINTDSSINEEDLIDD